MNWITTGLIAVFFLSSYNFVSKLFSSKISSLYALPFVAIGVCLASIISLLVIKLGHINNLVFTRSGALLATLGGLLWGIGGIFFFLMFTKGAPLSVGLPFVVGGLTIVGAILGITLLSEPVNLHKIVGIIVLFVSLVILSKV